MIRKGTAADIPALHEIINYYIRETTYNYSTREQSLAETTRWFNAMHTGEYDLFVLEVAGKVAGYASYGPFRSKTGYAPTVEHSVYLLPGYEGHGYGRALLTAIMDAAREKGYWTMMAVIDGSNQVSVDFHLHMGFSMVGTLYNVARKFNRPLDVVYLQLALNDPADGVAGVWEK
jgi:L-amino acid N-acyltransferase YncA